MRKTQLILLLMFAMLTSALFAGFWDDVLKVFADALSESSEKWGGRLTYLGAYSYSGYDRDNDRDRDDKLDRIKYANYVDFSVQNTSDAGERYKYNAYIKAYPTRGLSPTTVATFAKEKDVGRGNYTGPTKTKEFRIHASSYSRSTFFDLIDEQPNYRYKLHVELLEYWGPHRVIDSFSQWIDEYEN
ncbi:MAG TPA: hypothetical protein GX398_07555 [Candidatus Cloacimonetes bacterium]|jgi:hypothetical protein|nr:hypothetical protein [Candidatus Cloacimonadota bacterium]